MDIMTYRQIDTHYNRKNAEVIKGWRVSKDRAGVVEFKIKSLRKDN
jgi:hypothetical protein